MKIGDPITFTAHIEDSAGGGVAGGVGSHDKFPRGAGCATGAAVGV